VAGGAEGVAPLAQSAAFEGGSTVAATAGAHRERARISALSQTRERRARVTEAQRSDGLS
jgi:hypothetical protein